MRSLLPVLCILTRSLLEADGQCELSSLTENRLFSCQLVAAEYFTDLPDGVRVEFTASVLNRVGLPSWLQLSQFSPNSSVAYLHGTPPYSGSSLAATQTIMVQVQRKDTFELSLATLELTIDPAHNGTVSTAQLFITNHNMEDLLAPAGLQVFMDTLATVLGSPDPWLVSVTAPTSIGVLAPPPPSTHGVVVIVTAGYDAIFTMATDEESQTVQEGCSDAVANPPSNFDLFELYGYHIDWCRYEVGELSMAGPVVADVEMGAGEGVEVPGESVGSVPLVIVVVICVVVLGALLLGLGCLMFGGRRKSLISKDNTQLTVLRLTQEEGQPQVAIQVALRGLATLPHMAPTPLQQTTQDTSDPVVHSTDSQGPTPPPPYQYPAELL